MESYGADFEIDDDQKQRLSREHYSSNNRRKTISAIWGDKWSGMVEFTKNYVADMDSQGDLVAALSKSGKKHIGLMGFIEELTTYAATEDESYSFGDFAVRMSARVYNGFVRYELGLKGKEYRQHIIVPGYNEIKFNFTQEGYEDDIRVGELPFAPAGFPPQYAQEFWRVMVKS